MRILHVSPRQAWPPYSGAKLRDHYLARALGACSELTCVFFAERGMPTPTCQELPFCRAVIAVERPRRFSPATLVRGLLGQWPMAVLNYDSPKMRSRLRELIEAQKFDILHLDSV